MTVAAAVAAAILAGGQGRRLGGTVKPLLAIGEMRIIDRQLAVLRPLFDSIVLVVASGGAPADIDADLLALANGGGVSIIRDRQAGGRGPLAGVDAALAWLPGRFHSVVCVGGDMPFLHPAVLMRLRDAPPSAAAVVPRLSRGIEPLCARYHRSLGFLAARELTAGRGALHAFVARAAAEAPQGMDGVQWIDELELRGLDPSLGSFANVNTPQDLAAMLPR